jgi:hypothetical protein
MQFKPITAIIVLFLVVASLLVAGCTTSTTSNTNQTPSATSSTATHDAFLEKFLATLKGSWYADKNWTIYAWEVTWINSTSARLNYTYKLNTTSSTQRANVDVMVTAFPTTQDATNYLNAMNKTAYNLTRTDCSNSSSGPSGAYQDVTGHAAQICKDYERSTGNSSSSSDIRNSKTYIIYQLDNLIMEGT